MTASLTIGSLARQAGCPPETIRYYEREGLLPHAARTTGNYRLYGRAHLGRLVFIRNCRSLDMTLDEIRELLRFRDAPEPERHAAHALIDEHIEHLGTRISELQQLKRQLQALRRACRVTREGALCRVLDRLGHESADPVRKKARAHIRGAHGSS